MRAVPMPVMGMTMPVAPGWMMMMRAQKTPEIPFQS